jgi:hypothetical protein
MANSGRLPETPGQGAQAGSTPKKKKLWLIPAGIGCGAITLLSACFCGCGFWLFFPWNGVRYNERSAIMEQHNLNRAPGREGYPQYMLWEGAELIDDRGVPTRVVRVKFHALGTPERVNDDLHIFRAKLHTGQKNLVGDAWRTDPKAIDWNRVRLSE